MASEIFDSKEPLSDENRVLKTSAALPNRKSTCTCCRVVRPKGIATRRGGQSPRVLVAG